MYKTFIRSARNFEEFSKAKKITQAENLSIEEARNMCENYNKNRTSAQINKGTKMEFEQE